MPIKPTIFIALILFLTVLGPVHAQTSKDHIRKEEATPALTPLTTPIMQDQEIANWVQKVIPEIMTFTPDDYTTVLNVIKVHFSANGHKALLRTLERDKMIETIESNRLSISIGTTGVPRICRQQVQNGAHQWKIEVPKLFVYKAKGKGDVTEARYINITITRSNDAQNKEKVAIENWVTFIPPKTYRACDFVKQQEMRAMLKGMPASTKDAVEELFKLEEENKALKKQLQSLPQNAR